MLESLKQSVFEANMLLPHYGLVTFTWGNVSGIDREAGLFVIKPSGVPYEGMQAKDMVVMDMNGKVVEGDYKPSSDMHTHLVLYQNYPEIGGIVHTHSTYAAAWAQANRDIPAYGTTHADYMYGDIPCARRLTEDEVKHGYETATGSVIVETFTERKLKPLEVPAVIISNHGPFTWGKDAMEAVHNAVVLEEVARMAMITERIRPDAAHIDQYQLDKHYLRKHGANAYYGQTKKTQ